MQTTTAAVSGGAPRYADAFHRMADEIAAVPADGLTTVNPSCTKPLSSLEKEADLKVIDLAIKSLEQHAAAVQKKYASDKGKAGAVKEFNAALDAIAKKLEKFKEKDAAKAKKIESLKPLFTSLQSSSEKLLAEANSIKF